IGSSTFGTLRSSYTFSGVAGVPSRNSSIRPGQAVYRFSISSVFLRYFKEGKRETQNVCPGCLACRVDGAAGGVWRWLRDNLQWQNYDQPVDAFGWQPAGD